MSDEFVSLHTHTHYSRYDGLGTPTDFARRAAELGQTAISFTEHGNVSGLYASAKACAAAGIKHIPGLEAYLCDSIDQRGLTDDEKRKIREECGPDAKAVIDSLNAARRERDHITLWALDEVGYRNLLKLSSISWQAGYYYKPRLDMKTIRQYSAGLAASTGCPGGVVPSQIRNGNMAEAVRRTLELAEIFGDRFRVEVMPHYMSDFPDLQQKLVELSEIYGIEPIATQDAHYPHKHDAFSHSVFLCVQTQGSMNDPDRVQFDSFDYFLRSRAQMTQAFNDSCPWLSPKLLTTMLDNTVKLADMVSATVIEYKPGKWLAKPPLPPGVDSYENWLRLLIMEGVRWRHGFEMRHLPSNYKERIAFELKRIIENNFTEYFITVWDLMKWSADNGIMVGEGRGSAAGSLIGWYLGIHKIDSIKYDLSFDRFLAPGRKDLPDCDLDFASTRHPEVIAYLESRYGTENLAHISTNSTLAGRSSLQRIASAFDIPRNETTMVSSLIVEETEQAKRDASSAVSFLRSQESGRKYLERYPDVAEPLERIEGTIFTVGSHAAGVVIAPVPLDTIVPIETRASSDESGRVGRLRVTAFDMNEIEKFGLVKIDALRITSLDVVDYAVSMIREVDPAFDYDKIPVDDEATLKAFSEHRFAGIFQYDTPSSRKLCNGFEFKSIHDVAVITALNRPGPLKSENGEKAMAYVFVDRSVDPGLIESITPVYDKICANTLGIMVYQEQVIAVAKEYSGYSPEEADAFRKKIGKKKGLEDEREHFVRGAVSLGHPEEEAIVLFNRIVGFASYAFNKSHSYSYGMLGYKMMYLKVHYPAIFYAAYLTHAKKEPDMVRLGAECVKFGYKLSAPDVQFSGEGFTVSESGVVASLAKIKGIGRGVATAIIRERLANGSFASLEDFITRAKKLRRVNAGHFVRLAKATALRSLYPNTKFIVENARAIWHSDVSKRPIGISSARDYTREELVMVTSEVFSMFNDDGLNFLHLIEKQLLSYTKRDFYTPDTVPQEPGTYLVLGRLNASKKYAGDAKSKSARLSFIGEQGVELLARASSEVLEKYTKTIDMVGHCMLSIVTRGYGGSYSVDGLWLCENNLSTGLDPEIDSLLVGKSEIVKSFASHVRRFPPGRSGWASVRIIRVIPFTSKRGQRLAKMVVASREDFAVVMIFPSVYEKKSAQNLHAGETIEANLKTLEDGGLSLEAETFRS